MTCCIKGCEKPTFAKGMCSMHYSRMRKHGDPTKVVVKQVHGASLEDRFHAYVDKAGDGGCWVWVGSHDANGYGRLNVNNVPILAHRLAWRLYRSEISPEQHVLHRCDNPPCVNPDHLFLGDQAANNADMMAKDRFHPGVSRGEDHGCAKLTEAEVKAIRTSKSTPAELAHQYGVSRRTVRDILAMRSWRHLLT